MMTVKKLKSKNETLSGKKVRKGKKKKPIRIDLQAGFDKSGKLARVRIYFGPGNFISLGAIDSKEHMSIGETHHGRIYDVSEGVYGLISEGASDRYCSCPKCTAKGIGKTKPGVHHELSAFGIVASHEDDGETITYYQENKWMSKNRSHTDSIDGPFDDEKDIKWVSLRFLSQLHPDRLDGWRPEK